MVSLVIAALAGIALAAITLVDLEGLAAANEGRYVAAVHAADAALERAATDLRDTANWTGLGSGTQTSGMFDPASITSWGEPVDTTAMTAALRTESAAAGDPAAWRLFLSGPLAAWLPDQPVEVMPYVLVWIADGDAEPGGVMTVRVRARAVAPAGLRVEREAVLERAATTGAVRVRARWEPG